MELIKELLVTGVIAFLFSFLIAKLVSMAMSSGDSSHHDDSQTQNVDREAFSAAEIVGEEEEKGMTEELRYRERLEVEGLKSEMRTEFVEQVTEKVYEFVSGISSVEHAKDSATRDEILLESEAEVQELIEAVLKEEEEEDKLKEGEFYDEDVKQVNLVSSNRENREEEPIGVELNVVEEIGVAGSDSKERIEEIEVNEVEDDDDWEGIERSELEKIFGEAAKFVEESGNKDERLASVGSDLQMELYGLHKIATEGPCREQPPMALKVSARAKWNAWQRLGNMSPEAAMEQYIALVLERAPGWMEEKPSGDSKPGSSEVENLVAVTPDLSTLSSRQPNFTDEMTCRSPELKPVAEEGDPTGGSNLDSRPKNDKHCPAA
ncbi:acyl-CoA-binding domain-containing protein 3 [Populus alba]|uniref:Acyl-CoA-binding domain-containing protein 3-like isoform X1 n=1 Tax=Populus alba TaxID=43335 RepID=A0A4U5N816_POPAL|nr:acyl-CoA-binding domain-containing protein 3-like [Populus alba]TKR78898.1 acyl-CoA-binding domain-containing protein 3-like isoform X1 [Populus alba]